LVSHLDRLSALIKRDGSPAGESNSHSTGELS
jgi:hypothetical protein